MILHLLPILILQAAPAEPPPAPPADATPPADDLEKEFGATVAADQAEVAATQPAPAAPPIRSGALLDPEISFIGTFGFTVASEDEPAPFVAGDDPGGRGFTAQEVEIAFASDVDPYFKMRAFLTIPNLEGIEVEEAFLETTTLPYNLLLKGGVFRSNLGRNNEQHLHLQDFARRPRTTALLGDDGLRAPGVQLSYLTPLPWYTALYAEVFSLAPASDLGDKLSGTLVLEQFFDLSDTWSLLVGLNAARLDYGPGEGEAELVDPDPYYLAGADVYLKWKPTNVVDTYAWVAFTAEYFLRLDDAGNQQEGVTYGQLVAQVSRRLRVGARLDLVGMPEGPLPRREWAASGSLAFLPSEFSRWRLTYTNDYSVDDSAPRNNVLTLQWEAAIGAHGAHPF